MYPSTLVAGSFWPALRPAFAPLLPPLISARSALTSNLDRHLEAAGGDLLDRRSGAVRRSWSGVKRDGSPPPLAGVRTCRRARFHRESLKRSSCCLAAERPIRHPRRSAKALDDLLAGSTSSIWTVRPAKLKSSSPAEIVLGGPVPSVDPAAPVTRRRRVFPPGALACCSVATTSGLHIGGSRRPAAATGWCIRRRASDRRADLGVGPAWTAQRPRPPAPSMPDAPPMRETCGPVKYSSTKDSLRARTASKICAARCSCATVECPFFVDRSARNALAGPPLNSGWLGRPSVSPTRASFLLVDRPWKRPSNARNNGFTAEAPLSRSGASGALAAARPDSTNRPQRRPRAAANGGVIAPGPCQPKRRPRTAPPPPASRSDRIMICFEALSERGVGL